MRPALDSESRDCLQPAVGVPVSITFVGPSGSCEVPWMHYALLRDNILHHLEHGQPSASFVEVYRIGQVLGGPSQLLRATKLSEELAQARALCEKPIDDLALSSRTRAVLAMKQELPSGPPTEEVGPMRSLPWLPSKAQRLGDVFGYLIESLLSITRSARHEDLVQVFET